MSRWEQMIWGVCAVAILSAVLHSVCRSGAMKEAVRTVAGLAMIAACLSPLMGLSLSLPEEGWLGTGEMEHELDQQALGQYQASLDEQIAAAIEHEGQSIGIECSAEIVSDWEQQEYALQSVTLSAPQASAAQRRQMEERLRGQYGLSTPEQIAWEEEER